MSQPPLLPDEVLARVLRLARFDGLSVCILASLVAVMAAASGHSAIALIGLLGAGAGAVELHGVTLLRHGLKRGMGWLIASQPFLLGVIFAYCAYRLTHVEIPKMPASVERLQDWSARNYGMTTREYLELIYRLTYWILAGLSVFYQGGMTLYYLRRRGSVARALDAE